MQQFDSIDAFARLRHRGQYFTTGHVGAVVVGGLTNTTIQTAIDLGVGKGALVSAAMRRWPSARFVTVDIDPRINGSISKSRLRHKHYCVDALNVDLPAIIGLKEDGVDVAVCNPPFITPRWRPSFKELLTRAGLPLPIRALSCSADLLFLAQNLRMLRSGGALAIIVPSGFVSGLKNRRFREALLESHTINSVVELPSRSFDGADVQTFILTLTKACRSDGQVLLKRYGRDGTVSPSLPISASDAIQRMDYRHYAERKVQIVRKRADRPVLTVDRGVTPMHIAEENRWHIFHTTHFRDSRRGGVLIPKHFRPAPRMGRQIVAEPGDVLIARVGRGIEDKIVVITQGRCAVSDCVYRLRAEGVSGLKLARALRSDAGRLWIRRNVRGACASFLTKTDLLSLDLADLIDRAT